MANDAADAWPSELRVREKGRVLQITFDGCPPEEISAERLRAASPSADKRPAPAGVRIVNVETVGNYAARFEFSDGHDSGIYSWGLLRKLAAG